MKREVTLFFLALILFPLLAMAGKDGPETPVEYIEEAIYAYWYITLPIVAILLVLFVYLRNKSIQEE